MWVVDARRLRARLALRGWTQGDLAYAASMSPWGLSRIMGGHAMPTEAEVQQMAEALGCTPDLFADRYVKAEG